MRNPNSNTIRELKEYGVRDYQLNSCMGKLQDIQASSNLSIFVNNRNMQEFAIMHYM